MCTPHILAHWLPSSTYDTPTSTRHVIIARAELHDRRHRAARRHLDQAGPTTAGATWNKITGELAQLTLGTFTGPAGTFRQTADLTPAQRHILASLQIPAPKKIIQAAPAGPAQEHASA
jgi:hypothetical protein